MSQQRSAQWFTEHNATEGTAFGLLLEGRVHHEQSPYQCIEIYQTVRFGRVMVIDGCIMLTERDHFIYHEMMTHTALFCHPAPKRVAIIGGGDGGALTEVCKHLSITDIVQIEIDERVTRISEQYLPTLCPGLKDPRAKIHFADGIAWINAQQGQGWDIIIIDSTDPIGPAEGLFTASFYQRCYQALSDSGIVILQSESPILHLDPLVKGSRERLYEAGFDNVSTVNFPQPTYPAGWWTATMAGKGIDTESFRHQDSQHKPFVTEYYNAAIHQAALALPEFMHRRFTQPT